jgi:hypothetical protein
MRLRRAKLLALAAAGALLAGCNPPKYVPYFSPQGDYQVEVPWGWNIIVDSEGTHFTHVNFIGPFDPNFYLGVPSLSVRWYNYNIAHRLPDGLVEIYASADEYIKYLLESVYWPKYELVHPVHNINMDGGRLTAKHFIVLSATPADPQAVHGIEQDVEANRNINVRRHAYVVVPMTRGFYVLVYPATRQGYSYDEPQFNQLVNSFRPLSEGPGGPRSPRRLSPPPRKKGPDFWPGIPQSATL